jgi:hypothetical protein
MARFSIFSAGRMMSGRWTLSSVIASYIDRFSAWMSRNDIELFPCGSRSTTRVFTPLLARAAARLMVVVVLPTPPFWLVIAMIMRAGSLSGCSGAGQGEDGMSARRHSR